MKIIDLLNKIANEKDYKKIKFIFNGDTYTWNERKHDYDSSNTKHLETGILGYIGFSKYQLNRKIEIIEDTPKEEKKIPEKIECWYSMEDIKNHPELYNIMFVELKDKYNEIIDYLKSKGE